MRRILIVAAVLLCGLAQAQNHDDNVKLGGDFRYRHDYVDQVGRDERSRHQIRLRLNIEATADERVRVIAQLATGFDNPTAANQTLTDGFSSKSVAWNLAYIEAKDRRLPGLVICAGKTSLPWRRPGNFELIWDDDLNPEGVCAKYHRQAGRFSLDLAGAVYWVEERPDEIDSYLNGCQLAVTGSLPDAEAAFLAGVSYFSYLNIRGFPTFYNEERHFGNSVNEAGGYLTDFELVEILAEGRLDFMSVPVMLAADFVLNTTADSLETGWMTGLEIGRLQKAGDLSLRYSYREVESDAVVGVFADNIFAGGGADVKGHEINFVLQLAANTSLKVNYFNTEANLAATQHYERFQLDLRFKF